MDVTHILPFSQHTLNNTTEMMMEILLPHFQSMDKVCCMYTYTAHTNNMLTAVELSYQSSYDGPNCMSIYNMGYEHSYNSPFCINAMQSTRLCNTSEKYHQKKPAGQNQEEEV
jgi:chloramphenicol O-acetyltransferase